MLVKCIGSDFDLKFPIMAMHATAIPRVVPKGMCRGKISQNF
jgi:hypothetical protein